MSDPGRDANMDCLFAEGAMKLNNIKFFRGTDYLISEDRFTDEMCASIARQASAKPGASDRPPRCEKPSLDLRALVAEM